MTVQPGQRRRPPGGTLTAAAIDGVAGFYDLTLGTKATGNTLAASSSGLTSATSAPFNVTDLPAVTTQPPATVTAGTPFALTVTAENANGSTDTAFNGSVTISDASQTLGGTTTVTAVGGVATFSGLTLDQADAGGEDLSIERRRPARRLHELFHGGPRRGDPTDCSGPRRTHPDRRARSHFKSSPRTPTEMSLPTSAAAWH